MKRKIFSILFALVLVCSLGLVTAVPAGAQEAPTVTLDIPENVYRPAEFVASSTTTNEGTEPVPVYPNVRFNITVDGPVDFTGDRADTFTITKVNGSSDTQGINDTFVLVDGDWVGYWGSADGFFLTTPYNVTSTFTVQMCDFATAPVGDYDVTVELVDIEDPENPSPLATDEAGFTLSDDTLYVGKTEYAYQFTTIQAAIDFANPGDTINVAAGEYVGHILIDKALTVKSTDGAEETIIDGGGFRYLVKIYHSDVTFEGFTVTDPTYAGGSDATGILVGAYLGESVSNVRILNNIVTQVRSETGTPSAYGATGINIGRGPLSDIVISGNTITNIKNPEGGASDHTCGINVWDGAENVEISNNTISDIKYNGILLQRASNVLIEDNPMITECETGIRVEPFEEGAVSGLVIEDNILDGNHDGIVVVMGESLAILGNTITDFTKGGIVVMDVLSVEIELNTISTTDHSVAPNGIQVGYEIDPTATTGTIKDNQVSGCHWEGYDPETTDYEGGWTGSGILVIAPNSALEISGNEVQSCDVGLDIETGSGTLITNNDVHDNSYGFVLWNAKPTISFNDIYQNALCGVYRTLAGSLEGILNAENNWWGNASGPIPPGTYDSYGDKVSHNVDFKPWLLEKDSTTIYDKTLALKDGWTLVSVDKWIAAGDSELIGETLAYRYTPGGYEDATLDDLQPVDALYVKTVGGGGVGITYSGGVPVASSKDLEAGWNLISSATSDDAKAVLSPLRYIDVGDEQGVGLATLVSQGNYNQHTDSFYLATLSPDDWTTLGTTDLNPFDGYWVYMNDGKPFGVVPE